MCAMCTIKWGVEFSMCIVIRHQKNSIATARVCPYAYWRSWISFLSFDGWKFGFTGGTLLWVIAIVLLVLLSSKGSHHATAERLDRLIDSFCQDIIHAASKAKFFTTQLASKGTNNCIGKIGTFYVIRRNWAYGSGKANGAWTYLFN